MQKLRKAIGILPERLHDLLSEINPDYLTVKKYTGLIMDIIINIESKEIDKFSLTDETATRMKGHT